MSESVAAGAGPASRVASPPAGSQPGVAAGPIRKLQLVLAGLWLLDAILQFQSVMFTASFPRMLAESADGNPAFITGPVGWAARLIEQHVAAANAVFAVVQLLIALGIAWRPTIRLALGASVAWALAVWWLGEGLGGVLTGTAGPASGAPGAVILYALLAVLLWPRPQGRAAAFSTGQAVPASLARLAWVVLWGSLAYLALQPAVRAPHALSGTLSEAAAGQPGWLAGLDSSAASALDGHGLAVAIGFAVALAVIAGGVFLAPGPGRAIMIMAIVLAALIWLAEGLGGLLSGSATDPDSGPPLALLALAYWPARTAAGRC